MVHKRQVGSQQLILECSDRYSDLGASVLDKIVELHGAGPPLHNGSTIQFGWSLLTLRADECGLRVCEPDFYGDISRTQPFVEATLEILRAQVPVLRAVGEDGVDVRFDQVVTLTRGCIGIPDLFLKRDLPEFPEDTGWFIGRLDDLEAARAPRDIENLRVYELLRQRAVLMQLLTLPPGYLAIVRKEKIVALLDKYLKLRWGNYPG
jgi:hypothetical protein